MTARALQACCCFYAAHVLLVFSGLIHQDWTFIEEYYCDVIGSLLLLVFFRRLQIKKKHTIFIYIVFILINLILHVCNMRLFIWYVFYNSSIFACLWFIWKIHYCRKEERFFSININVALQLCPSLNRYTPPLIYIWHSLSCTITQSISQNVLQYLKLSHSSRKLCELVEAVGISGQRGSRLVT